MKTILFLFISLSISAQKYRVRAVQDSIYIQDTLPIGHSLKVWSPYVKDFLLTLTNPDGYIVDVMQPHTNGWKPKEDIKGWYSYELIWFDFRGKRSVKSGKVFVL
jgi:hypothetical protein